jgi:cell division protein FtsW (lipid II flippase)
MGGSSILFTSTSLGMILSVSWGVEADKKEEAEKIQTEKMNVVDE